MRNLFIALCMLAFCQACELSEQTDLCINYRPTLQMRYSFLDNRHREVVDERVGRLTCFVFDEKGIPFRRVEIPADSLLPGSGLRILEGVPDGEYRVCTFANGLPAEEVAGGQTASSDSLYHHVESYQVVRGRLTEQQALLKSLFCRVAVSVEGLPAGNEAWYGVEIAGVPAGFDYAGDLSDATVSVVPALTPSAGSLQGNCCIYRMPAPEGVWVRLRETRPNGSSALLFEQSLDEFLSGVDMEQPDISLPVRIRLHRGGATISIRDWETEMEQVEVVGNV